MVGLYMWVKFVLLSEAAVDSWSRQLLPRSTLPDPDRVVFWHPSFLFVLVFSASVLEYMLKSTVVIKLFHRSVLSGV